MLKKYSKISLGHEIIDRAYFKIVYSLQEQFLRIGINTDRQDVFIKLCSYDGNVYIQDGKKCFLRHYTSIEDYIFNEYFQYERNNGNHTNDLETTIKQN